MDIPNDIQVLPIELNLKKTKWLLLPVYKPPCQNDMYFVRKIERIVDFYSNSIGNVLAFGDFNMEESHPCIQSLIQQYSLYNLIRSPTCFKRVPGKCIDLMLTNTKHSIFGSQTMETGFSDFHHMIYTILKTKFNKVPPKIIEYRD